MKPIVWEEFKTKLICFFVGHDWSMYAGYEQIRVHSSAECLRCGKKYNENSSSGGRSY